MAVNVSDEQIERLAPDEDTLRAARGLVDSGEFLNPGVSADGTWLLAECRGSAAEPYHVSVDLADPAAPTFRCTCPSRKQPCKHGLGLLLLNTQDPGKFGSREPTEDLLIKREKKAALDEKKRTGAAVPRKISRAAQDKKAAAQREGLELLEKMLVDLVAAGHWFEESRLEKIDRLAKHLTDSYLPAPMHLVRKLVLVGRAKDLSDEERMALSADVVGQLWATVQKGRQYLDPKPDGANSSEADAVMEEVLGRTWQMSELRDKGYVRTNLSLMELAFERTDDETRQQRLEISDLLDLNSGDVYQAIAFRPFKGLSQVPEQTSYQAPFTVPEAVIYPGFLNQRVRWEKGTEQGADASRHLEKAYELAKPDLKAVIDAYRGQLQQPLAPREAVVLVRAERIGRIGRRVVIEDADSGRIEAADKRSDYSNVANLVRAAGMLGKEKPVLLLRLFLRPVPNTIAAVPLAALTPKHHLRLGL